MSNSWVTHAPVDFTVPGATAPIKEETQLVEVGSYRHILDPYVLRIADEVSKIINKTVPSEVPGMRYARQWVLEELIKALKDRV